MLDFGTIVEVSLKRRWVRIRPHTPPYDTFVFENVIPEGREVPLVGDHIQIEYYCLDRDQASIRWPVYGKTLWEHLEEDDD